MCLSKVKCKALIFTQQHTEFCFSSLFVCFFYHLDMANGILSSSMLVVVVIVVVVNDTN